MSQQSNPSTGVVPERTSKPNPSPMMTTHDSLYFLSIVSFTSLAAICREKAAQVASEPPGQILRSRRSLFRSAPSVSL